MPHGTNTATEPPARSGEAPRKPTLAWGDEGSSGPSLANTLLRLVDDRETDAPVDASPTRATNADRPEPPTPVDADRPEADDSSEPVAAEAAPLVTVDGSRPAVVDASRTEAAARALIDAAGVLVHDGELAPHELGRIAVDGACARATLVAMDGRESHVDVRLVDDVVHAGGRGPVASRLREHDAEVAASLVASGFRFGGFDDEPRDPTPRQLDELEGEFFAPVGSA